MSAEWTNILLPSPLGALYLAYDLLGGEHGPLRTLTRTVTHGALFGLGYGLVLGPPAPFEAPDLVLAPGISTVQPSGLFLAD